MIEPFITYTHFSPLPSPPYPLKKKEKQISSYHIETQHQASINPIIIYQYVLPNNLGIMDMCTRDLFLCFLSPI